MRFIVQPEIFAKFPHLQLGGVVARGIVNSGRPRELTALIQDIQNHIRNTLVPEELSRHPKIQAWRTAYSAFGAKPKKYKSSVESLYRMILKGMDLRPINPLVDVYNYISLKHMVPVGGDDLDRVEGDIFLKRARGDESFLPLNAEVREIVKPGEVVYADAHEILCRRWNWRECDKTKMTEATVNAVLVVEGLPPWTGDEVVAVCRELEDRVREYCGGWTRRIRLHAGNPQIEL